MTVVVGSRDVHWFINYIVQAVRWLLFESEEAEAVNVGKIGKVLQ